jgi:anti-sigma-K factor RskA
MRLDRPDRSARLDALAAEFALGTLSARARRRLAAAARVQPVVAQAIADWETRLATLATSLPPVTPSPRVWAGIRRRLGLADPAAPATAPWWASLGLWRGLALAGFALAFALGVVVLAPPPVAPEPAVVAVLAGSDGKPALIATADRGGRTLLVKVVAPIAPPADRALELWALPEGRDPRSLGLVPASGTARIALPVAAENAFAGTPALAITLEPAGGAPAGKPTGPVLYTGSIARLL